MHDGCLLRATRSEVVRTRLDPDDFDQAFRSLEISGVSGVHELADAHIGRLLIPKRTWRGGPVFNPARPG
jgi:hypothetical protein